MPSLRDYFNLKACPRVVFGTSYFKELCLSATQTTGLCRADRRALGSAALLQLRALDHQDTSPYRAYRSESYRAQRLQKTLYHTSITAPGKLPMFISKRRDTALSVWPHHIHLYWESNTLKINKNQCRFWVVHWAFSCGFICSFGLFPLPLNSTLKGFILEWR